MQTSLYEDLKWRGLIHQVTDPLLEKELNAGKLTLYAGFDPTSDSLHIGNLLPLVTLRRFQLAGHTPIAVVGGATGSIGDPSGKTQERKLLDEAQLDLNLKGIKKDISKILDFSAKARALLLNNFDWFKTMGTIDFLRDVGKHFTVNHMMAKDSVRSRLEDREQGISYTEFSYMLLQAHDFYVLNEKHKCRLQIGGSDQWGNITAGCELIRRKRHADENHADVYGLTFPLIMKADGTKFGKSESGSLWMSAEKTSPYAFYQYFIQTSDADVIQWLKFFTFLSSEEISKLESSIRTAPEKREAQLRLAEEVTLLVHGDAELKAAKMASQALFGEEIKNLNEKTLLSVFAGAPTTEKKKADLKAGALLLDLLVESGLCASKGAAKRDLTSGGIYLNNERISDEGKKIQSSDLIAGRYAVLRKGKKNYSLVRFD